MPSSETCLSRVTSANAVAIPVREERVSLDLELDLGQEQLVRERQRLRVELGAADHRHPLRALEQTERVVERACALGAVRRASRDCA